MHWDCLKQKHGGHILNRFWMNIKRCLAKIKPCLGGLVLLAEDVNQENANLKELENLIENKRKGDKECPAITTLA